jgi:hypothetical protein
MRPVTWVLQLGLMVLSLGLAGDLVHHLAPTALGVDGHGMHLVLLVGMVLILAGVLERGLRHEP